jgi:hypothetical protein
MRIVDQRFKCAAGCGGNVGVGSFSTKAAMVACIGTSIAPPLPVRSRRIGAAMMAPAVISPVTWSHTTSETKRGTPPRRMNRPATPPTDWITVS